MAPKPKTPPPLSLAKVNVTYGAPMGRHCIHRRGLTNPQFQVERVPLTDGGYDAGAVYWGTPDNLWLADFTTPITGTTIIRYFIRAENRKAAMIEVLKSYPDALFLPETGSIIEQTIKALQDYLTTLTDRESDEEVYETTEQEIAILEDQLANIRRG